MVYDRYGQYKFDSKAKQGSQSCEPSLAPAAGASGGIEGPVPNTEYKGNQGDDKALTNNDELVLTPDALKHYEELSDKRRGIADEVRAEVGECEFKLEKIFTCDLDSSPACRQGAGAFILRR